MQSNNVVCELCGKSFKQITESHLKKEHKISFSDYKIMFPDSITISKEVSNKISESAVKLNREGKIGFKKGHKVNANKEPWNKNKVGLQVAWNKGKTKEICPSLKITSEKLSQIKKQMYKTGKIKRLCGKDNPMYGKHISEQHKKAMWGGWKNSFTKPELKIMNIIKEYKDWEYVGNGKFYLHTKKQCRIPDFISRNEKKIIEVYGDYWHRGENPNDKISEYKEIGWDCIVVWESEIMSNDFGIEQIRYFL